MSPRRQIPLLFFSLAIAGLALAAACSRPAANGGSALTPGLLPSAEVRSGAAAQLLPGAFRSGAVVHATYDPNASEPAPASSWAFAPGALHAGFVPALGAPASASRMGLRLSMPYPARWDAEILTARAPVVRVAYAGGGTREWLATGRFDRTHDRVTVELPAGSVERATGLTLALAVDAQPFEMESPGPRYWTGSRWSKTGTVQSGKSTVVLIHGIFSSVESAFPTPRPWQFWTACPKRIAVAGKFQQVLGFDYAWNEPPDTEGPLFADFLRTILAAKVASLSIEAHSYGSLVTLAAIPAIKPDGAIENVVTMGGPLPLRGTPLADPKNHWRMGMVLGLMAWYFDEPPSVIDRAYDSGMVASLATDSSALQKILGAVKAMPKKPHFVEAAGTKWICFIPGITGCNYSEETFKKVLVDGSGVELPWDGVVEVKAANSPDIPDAVATAFPLSHIDLECDDDLIGWVGKQLK